MKQMGSVIQALYEKVRLFFTSQSDLLGDSFIIEQCSNPQPQLVQIARVIVDA